MVKHAGLPVLILLLTMIGISGARADGVSNPADRVCWPLSRAAEPTPRIWLLATATDAAGLRHTGEDARRFVATFQTFTGLSASGVCVLEQARRGEIEAAFRRLRSVAENDLVVSYFSGHGTKVADDGNRDEPVWEDGEGLEEVFVTADLDLDNPDLATALRDDHFADWVAALPGDNFLAVIDACFGADLPRVPGDQAGLRRKYWSLGGKAHGASALAEQSGSRDPVRGMVLAGAGGAESAFERSGKGGLFTHALIEALAAGYDPADDFDDWYDPVIDRVYAVTGQRQTPQAGGNRQLWRRWFGPGSVYMRAKETAR